MNGQAARRSEEEMKTREVVPNFEMAQILTDLVAASLSESGHALSKQGKSQWKLAFMGLLEGMDLEITVRNRIDK